MNLLDTHKIRFFCNGKAISAGVPARIVPGSSNRLSVELDSPLALNAVVRMEVCAPDGTKRVESVSPVNGIAECDLGPLCAPAIYDYENGMVFRRGYCCTIFVEDDNKGVTISELKLGSVCSQEKHYEWLQPDASGRCLYSDGYIPENGGWNPFGESSGVMQPALQIKLAPEVLLDNGRCAVLYRTRPEPPVGQMQGLLRIVDEKCREMVAPVEVTADARWKEFRPETADWPDGIYTVELLPKLNQQYWEDCPRLFYRKQAFSRKRIQISPYAPYTLERDDSRNTVEISQWPDDTPEGWECTVNKNGEEVLFSNGDPSSSALSLKPKVEGMYAVFAEAVNSIHIRTGGEDIVRKVHEPEKDCYTPVFVTVADLTGQTLEIFPNNLESLRVILNEKKDDTPAMKEIVGAGSENSDIRSGLKRLLLIPVTSASVDEFRNQTVDPPYELRGVDDWWCYFRGWDRADRCQLDTIVQGQREIGISALNWALGRSWVQYPTRLPAAEKFPCAPVDAELLKKSHPHFIAWEQIVDVCDCLGYPLQRKERHGMRIHGWLAMNRHYSPEAHGGVFTSAWARSHPEYRQYRKNMLSIDVSRMEYFFPEVRKERVDILEEVAGYSPDALVIGCCRQPPMCGYNPEMVETYKKLTGTDPTAIDFDDGQPYLEWISWRADFFTEVLHELKDRLIRMEREIGRKIPVIARIPGAGLLWNLTQGMDVRTWVREGLIDELQLDPLQSFAPDENASHDVRPYLELCRNGGITVFGGVNGTTGANRGAAEDNYSPLPGLRRAIGLLRAGVDGIEIYEAEVFAACSARRWLIPLWGDPDRAVQWLQESNLEAVYPITAQNAAFGHDNHWFGGETTHREKDGRLKRGSKRVL